jgi:hypothetical protein
VANAIVVYASRLKKVQFTWRSGVSASSPPIDLTGSTCTIQGFSLKKAPAINILDGVNGLCELVFNPDCTQGLNSYPSNPHWISIALTNIANPGYSPDPIRVEVAIR